MIIFMSEIICITNRKLCKGSFLGQIEKIAAARPDRIVLREKDLSEAEYTVLAKQVMEICDKYEVSCTLHNFVEAAAMLVAKNIHLPLPVLRTMTDEIKCCFESIGTSCHSRNEAEEAEKLGASCIAAGHIFETDCKAGMPGRGLDFLREIKSSVNIPVFAIGGISTENAEKVIGSGADGICMMSSFMKSKDPARLISALREVTYSCE